MPHIYSTLSNDQEYVFFHERELQGGPHEVKHRIRIKGGANMAKPRFDANATYTPEGAHTEVTGSEMELLLTHDQFQKHVDNGFITISDSKEKVATVLKGMEAKDASAPYVSADYEKGGRAQRDAKGVPGLKIDEPTVGSVDEE